MTTATAFAVDDRVTVHEPDDGYGDSVFEVVPPGTQGTVATVTDHSIGVVWDTTHDDGLGSLWWARPESLDPAA